MTIRHYSRLFALFVLFVTIRCSVFATIRYSLFGFSRHLKPIAVDPAQLPPPKAFPSLPPAAQLQACEPPPKQDACTPQPREDLKVPSPKEEPHGAPVVTRSGRLVKPPQRFQ